MLGLLVGLPQPPVDLLKLLRGAGEDLGLHLLATGDQLGCEPLPIGLFVRSRR